MVTAVDLGVNESGYSNEDSDTPTDVAPVASTGLGATAGYKQVSLNWDDNSEPDLAGYNVYRGLSSGNYTYIDNVVAPTSSYTDTGLTNGVIYYYVVTAIDLASNESGNSNEDSAMPFNPPITLLDDNFEGTPWDANWDGNGASTFALDNKVFRTGLYSAKGKTGNVITSDDLDASSSTDITLLFWFYPKQIVSGDAIVEIYNGSAYNTW